MEHRFRIQASGFGGGRTGLEEDLESGDSGVAARNCGP